MLHLQKDAIRKWQYKAKKKQTGYFIDRQKGKEWKENKQNERRHKCTILNILCKSKTKTTQTRNRENKEMWGETGRNKNTELLIKTCEVYTQYVQRKI